VSLEAHHVLLMIGSVALAGFFAGSENGIYALNRWRLRHRREDGWRSAKLLGALVDDPRKTVTAILVGTNVSYYVLSATVAGLVAASAPERWRLFGVIPMNAEVASGLLLLLPTFILAEVIPKNFFRHRSETLLYRVALPLYVWVRLLWPLSTVLQGLSSVAMRLTGGGGPGRRFDLSRRRLLALMAEGVRSGEISRHQVSLGSTVMRLGSMRLEEVMVPLADAVVLSETAPVKEFLLAAKMKGIWRALLRNEDGRTASMASLYDAMGAEPDAKLASIRRDVMALPAGTPLSTALVSMQAAQQVLAVVTGPEGEAVGQVSMEGLVGTITAAQD